MPNTQKTGCKSIIAAIDDYIDGSLSAEDCLTIDAHLTTCSGCRAYLDDYRKMLQLTRSAFDSDSDDTQVPDGMIERTLAKLKKP